MLFNRYLKINYRCIRRHSFLKHNEETSKKSQVDEKIKRRENMFAKKKLNWENLELFGPLLDRRTTNNKKTAKQKSVSSVPNLLSATETLSHLKIRQLLFEPISFDGLLDQVNTNYNEVVSYCGDSVGKFPFSHIGNSSSETLTDKVSSIIDTDGMFLSETEMLPSVTSILEKSMTISKRKELARHRLKIIHNVGLKTYLNHLQELREIEIALLNNLTEYFSGTPVEFIKINSNVEGYWNSAQAFINEISDVTLQRSIQHPYLHYTGILDCIAWYRGRRVLIEWILPQEQLPLWRSSCELPLRSVAYAGALNAAEPDQAQICSVILVVLHPTEPATIIEMEDEICKNSWYLWLYRLKNYWKIRKNSPGDIYINFCQK